MLLSISSQSKWQQRTESEFLWYGIFLPLSSCVMQFFSLCPHACHLPCVLLLHAKGLSQTMFAMHLNIVLSWPKIAGQQRFVGLQKSSTHGGIISFYSLSHTMVLKASPRRRLVVRAEKKSGRPPPPCQNQGEIARDEWRKRRRTGGEQQVKKRLPHHLLAARSAVTSAERCGPPSGEWRRRLVWKGTGGGRFRRGVAAGTHPRAG